MLSFQQLSLRRQAKLLVEDATLTIYAGFKVGLSALTDLAKPVYSNSFLASSTLIRAGEIPPTLRIAHMAQEVPASSMTAVDYVLSGDTALQQVAEKLRPRRPRMTTQPSALCMSNTLTSTVTPLGRGLSNCLWGWVFLNRASSSRSRYFQGLAR